MSETVQDQLYYEKFRDQLNTGMKFPEDYPFKFIVKSETDAQKQIEALFEGTGAKISTTPSSKGNYTSVTIIFHASSADEIIDKYKAAAGIPDVIKL